MTVGRSGSRGRGEGGGDFDLIAQKRPVLSIVFGRSAVRQVRGRMTIEAMLIVGFVAGLLIGIVLASPKVGCAALLLVPITTIVYIGVWQSQHPENIRSTSALDFVFGPLWPGIGAVAGFVAARAAREMFSR